jgi:hypothetical protein
MEVQLISFLTTTLDRSGQLHAITALTLGNNPQDTWNRKLGEGEGADPVWMF